METFSIILTSTMIKIFYYNYTIFFINKTVYIYTNTINQLKVIQYPYNIKYQAGAKVSI